ncbi:pyruvate dehydrogenase kinase-like protein [Haematococcus lacustris]
MPVEMPLARMCRDIFRFKTRALTLIRQHSSSSGRMEFYDSTVERYAAQPVEVLSLYQMLEYGRDAWCRPDKLTRSARFVQRELPKRLARRLLDLQLLPYIVVTNPHIKLVYDSYHSAFQQLRTLPPVRTLQDNERFCGLLAQQLDMHARMLDTLAHGLREVKRKQLVGPCLQLDPFFESLLRSRISRRVLAEQHLQLGLRRPGYVGILCTLLNVAEAVEFAAAKCRQVCQETYGVAPDFVVSGDRQAALPYIPTHLDYMLYELFKNAARAVVEHHLPPSRPPCASSTSASAPPRAKPAWGAGQELPPIHVRICAGRGAADLSIRVSDQGGGIPPHLITQVWSYGFTTVDDAAAAPAVFERGDEGGSEEGWGPLAAEDHGRDLADGRFRMAGLGFGLPLSRLHARYFGGDLVVQVIPGYGTDCYLTLKRLDDDAWQQS